MKHIPIILLISFLNLISYAQNSFEIDYHSLENGDNYECTLNTNEYLSSWSYKKQTSDADVNLLNDESYYFFKDKKNKVIYYQDNILSKEVFVKDSLHRMNWEITNKEKKILDFICKEARTIFRGREYIAYYTEDIALSDGPWKFGGLPGLILEIKSIDGYLAYNAYKITKVKNQNIVLPKTRDTKYLSWDEFSALFIKIYDNYMNLIKTSEDVSLGSEVNINVQTIEIIYPKIQKEAGYVIKRN